MLKQAYRSLRRSAGTTLLAVVCLAVGIGANTTAFATVDRILLRPLAFANTPRLVQVLSVTKKIPDRPWMPMSYADFADYRAQNGVFASMGASEWWETNVIGRDEPERVIGFRVTANFFDMLGVHPELGRGFSASEEHAGAPPVVVLSHGLWQRRFGGDPRIVGSTVRLDGVPFTVIGVMAKDFSFPPAAALWAPLQLDSAALGSRGARDDLRPLGLLKPGITLARARGDLGAIAKRLAATYPEDKDWETRVDPIDYLYTSQGKPYILLVAATVGFLLLIVCANVANLLLARATSRRKEIAIRVALGASRAAIIRQLLTESVLLAIVGGALGVGLAAWGADLMTASLPPETSRFVPGWNEIGVDGRALAFTLLLSTLTGIIFGVFPALQAAREDVQTALKDGGRGASSGPRTGRLRGALATFEIAMAVVLLTGTGLVVRSFISALRADTGFRPDHVLTMELALGRTTYPDPASITRFYDQLVERVRALPGVRGAAVTNTLPLSGSQSSRSFVIDGRPAPKADEQPAAEFRMSSASLLDVLGIQVVRGRAFESTDRAGSPPVAIINQVLAARYFPNENPIGRRISIGGPSGLQSREIVGVVANVRHTAVTDAPRSQIYVPFGQLPARRVGLAVRTSGDPAALAASVQHAINSLDASLAAGEVRTMERSVSVALSGQRIVAGMLATFAGVAIVLSLIGIYGVVSYGVAQRTHEFGIRMALGADRRAVLMMVVRQALRMAGIGVAIGVATAWLLTSGMTSLLFGVAPHDPATFAGTAVLLGLVAILASYLPALRATRVDPAIALRND